MRPASGGSAHPGAGIALVLLMGVCFASMDTSVKAAGAVLPVLVILSARYGVQAGVMGLWLLASRRRPGGAGFRADHPRFQLARGLLLLISSMFGFFALQYLPVAEFTAIAMLTPVLVTLMSAWLLHERVSPLRWWLIAGGFAGALIVIRPGSGLFGWAALLPLASAIAYASFQVLTRKLSALENPFTTHFYTGLTGTVVIATLMLASPIDLLPALRDAAPLYLGLLLLIGSLGTAGHLMLVLAFGLAPTSTLMPFIYAQIGFAALISWLVFRATPDGWGWVGMSVIAACGAATVWLNLREAARLHEPVSALSADAAAD
jgi:drug/metabolite transporter (DMT)-like permease